jgi:7,8-dihydroneopterin aldolase/epimerase/oxygenase
VQDDLIFIRDFRCDAWIGVYDWEQAAAQTLDLNIEYGLLNKDAEHTDSITDTIDYGKVVERVRAELKDHRFKLLEALAECVAQIVLKEFGAPWVRINVAKIHHVKGVGRLGVSIYRRA